MKSEVQEILVPDLNAEALEEIADLLGGDVRIEDASNPQEGGRDITTATAVVLVSLAALRVLAVWITRHTTSEETEVSIQTKRNDGSVKTISFRKRSSSAPIRS